jgi:hypothetical protein
MLKAHPDMAKLNSFSMPFLVTITRHLVPRGGEGTSAVSTQLMTREQLLNWQGVKLLTDFGPGYYHFHVVDPGGQGEDEWKVKLGTEAAAQEGQMPGPFGSPVAMPAGPTAPLDSDVKQIMPGFWYNEALGLLHTRWGTTVPWKQGEPWPSAPLSTSASTTATAPGATWAYPGWNGGGPSTPWMPGWGNFPAADDSKLEAMKLQLAEQERRLETEQRRRDEDKREREAADARAETRRLIEENQKQMMALVERLTAKPDGPSARELALEREASEERRRREDLEREEKREERRREDMRIADERHREEMRVFREAAASKPDPMLNLLTQFMTTSQVTQGENVRMIRESSAQATAAAERGAGQVLELARTQRDGAIEAARTTVDMMKENMGVQKDFFTQMLEMKGTDSTPWWGSMIQEGLNRVGAVGEMLAQRQQQQAQQTQYVPPPQPQQQRPRAQTVPGIPVAPSMPAVGRPGFIDTGGRPAGAEHDVENDEWVLPGGHRVKNSVVQQRGWKFALEDLSRRISHAPPVIVPAPAAPTEDAPMNGASNGAGHAPPAATAAAPAPTATAPRGRRAAAKPRHRRAPRAQAPAMAPPADPKGYTGAEVAKASILDVFEATKVALDPEFFGEVWNYVQQLRTTPPEPEAAVGYILQARSYVRSMGKNPPAMELIDAGHFEVLVMRLFPGLPEDYQHAIVDGLRAQLSGEGGDAGGEGGGEGEGGDDEEGDDDGEEAQQ